MGLEIAGTIVGHRSRASGETHAIFAPDALKRAADERVKAIRAALEDERTWFDSGLDHAPTVATQAHSTHPRNECSVLDGGRRKNR